MNPTTNTEAGAVADVAAKLTEAQRHALVSCWQKPGRHDPYHIFASTRVTRKAWRDMIPLGIVSSDENGFDLVVVRERPTAMVGLSPLGIAVRQHLEQGATAGVVGGKERG